MAEQPTSKPLNHAGVWIPPPLLYVVPLLLARFLQSIIPLPFLPASITVVAAVLLFIVGVVLCIWSIGLFRSAKTSLIPVKPSATLVLHGPYKFSRNPMYLGLLVLYLAAAFWLNSVWALLLVPLVIVLVHYVVIAKEERYLEQRFGESYRQYQAHVRRWI